MKFRGCLLSLVVLCVGADKLPGVEALKDLGIRELVMIQRQPLKPTHVYTYHVEGLQKGAALEVMPLDGGEPRRLVDSPEGVILDCQVSYDGQRILFSWRRSMSEPFGIWTIDVDGRNLTHLIGGESNNVNACWLPDGGIAFLSDRKPAYAYCWTSTSPVLYRSDGDGTNIHRLSANYLTDFTPSVMRDGRILFSRWEYVDRPAIPIQSLWAMHPDGTMLSGVFGNRILSPATFMEARDVPGMPGHILCVMTSHNGPCRGAIGLIDPSKGGNAQEAIRNLTPEIEIGTVDDARAGNRMRGPYESPYPLDERHYLVSKAGTIELRDYEGKHCSEVRAPAEGEMGYYSAQPIRPRPKPVSKVATHIDPDSGKPATVLMQDVRIGLGDAVKPGEVKRIAVVQEMEKDILTDVDRKQFGFQFPVVSCGATYAPKRVWGIATVEKDGSAHFEVPTGVPVYFLPLDEHGRAVQRMRTFTHFMPGERQSCIGCHADRNYATAPPAVMKGATLAAQRPAEKLHAPEWGNEDGFSFARIVQPVLDQNCLKCHDGEVEPDLSGDRTDYFNVAYENLARKGTEAEHGGHARGGMKGFGKNPYTSWIPTYNGCESNILEIAPKAWGSPASPLADLLIAGHPDEDGNPRIDLDPDELQRILMWIDLNVPYYGTSQSQQPDLRGCRRIVPENLEAVLDEVAKRRGFELPRTFYIRLDHPEKNPFLALPLKRGDFTGTDDPDYQRILQCFEGLQESLEQRIDVDFRDVIQAAARGER